MAKIEIKDASGKKVNEADLNAAVFGIEPNVHVMHTVVRAYRAAMRQGTHDTKTRGEVGGGGKKPWRQKGTGRARQGTIRAPHWVGGGTVFGPHPRSYAFRVNRKEVKLAMRSALVRQARRRAADRGRRLQLREALHQAGCCGSEGTGLRSSYHRLVVADDDVNTYLSFRNIERVNIIPVSEANTMELVDNKVLVLTAAALERLEEVLA